MCRAVAVVGTPKNRDGGRAQKGIAPFGHSGTEFRDDRVDVATQRVDAHHRFRHLGIEEVDVHRLACVARLHIRTHREIVVVGRQRGVIHQRRNVRFFALLLEEREQTIHLFVRQHIVLSLLAEKLLAARVDELREGVGLVLREHEDAHRDARAEKEVGREGDDALHKVVVHQVLADLLFRSAAIEDAGEAHDGGAAARAEVVEGVENEGKIGLSLRRQHAGRGKTLVVDERGVVAPHPLHRVGRVGHDGVEGARVAVLRREEGVAQREVELVVVHIVQEEVHARQVERGVVDLLPHETALDHVFVKLPLGLQQQRTRTAGRVVDLVHLRLSRQGEARDELRHGLRGEKLAARLAGVRRIVRNQKLVGVAEEVDLVVGKVSEIQTLHPAQHGAESAVFLLDGVAQLGAGGVEVGKKPLDGALRSVAHGRSLDGGEDGRQLGVEIGVAVGRGHHLCEELRGIDEIALFARHGVDELGIHLAVGIFCVVLIGVAAFHVGGKIFADVAVEEGAEHKLFEVPAVDSAAHIVGDAPNGGLKLGALGGFGHRAEVNRSSFVEIIVRIYSFFRTRRPSARAFNTPPLG